MLINGSVHGKSKFGKIVVLLLGLTMMLALLSLVPPKAHAATDRWVATTGSDTSGNGTSGAPYATITKAASVAVGGDTIKVKAGNYTGGFQTTKSGTSNSARIKYISIDGPGQATIKPGSSTEYLWDNRGDYVDIEGFQFDGTNINGTYSAVRNGLMNQGKYVTIKGNDVHHIFYGTANQANCTSGGGAGINILDYNVPGFLDGVVVDGNYVHDIGWLCDKVQSIYISTRATVTNNVVYNNLGGAGIHLWHDAHDVTVENNTVVNHWVGIVVGSGDRYEACSVDNWGCIADNIIVANNIVYGSHGYDSSKHLTGYGIDESGTAIGSVVYTNNLLYDNDSDWLFTISGHTGVNTVSANPQFVDYANKNFKLQSNSPAINAGSSTYAPPYDLEGTARPSGSVDIGAYEYTGSSGSTNLAAGKTFTGSTLTSAAAITDGITNDSSYPNGYGTVTSGAQSIQVDLGASYDLGKVKVWHYYPDGRTYHDVIVQLSNDSTFATGVTTVFNNDTNNSAGQGTGTDAEYAETSAGKDIVFSPVNARYVRLWTNGSTANTYGHYMEVQIFQATNYAAGKTFTGSTLTSAAAITDGITNDSSYPNGYGTVTSGAQSIKVDLGASHDISSVKVWHYYPDGRTYHDVIVQLSNDVNFASGVTTVFNNDTNNSAGQGTGTDAEYAETSAGKSIAFSPVNARYVRLWTNGSTANTYGHYMEVQVWGQ
jgi:hypothetical protein